MEIPTRGRQRGAARWLVPSLARRLSLRLMAFEKGGKIPGEGAVPILAHGGETVVTKALTDRVERSESSGNAHAGNMNVNYSPTYHGQYNEGEHQRRFDRSMKDLARRRGMRWN